MNDGAPKPKARWCTQTAQWISPEVDGDDLYDVAVQCGEGKPIYTGMYKAPDDTALIDLVVKMMGVNKESDFTVFDVHKSLPENAGVLVIRESNEWPRGVPIIRTKGVTMRGSWQQQVPSRIITPDVPTSARPKETKPKAAASAKETKAVAVVVATLLEKSIPCVPYTLKQAV